MRHPSADSAQAYLRRGSQWTALRSDLRNGQTAINPNYILVSRLLNPTPAAPGYRRHGDAR
eukprot:37658-Eustigmatos_ZCMA.PRE.1